MHRLSIIRQATRRIAHNVPASHGVATRLVASPLTQAIRCSSTSATTPRSTEVPLEPILSPAAPPTQPRSKSTRYLRRTITILSFFLVGAVGGGIIAGILIPPPLPAADTEEDSTLLAKLKRDYSALEIVRELRTPESKAAGWIEYESFMGLPEELREKHMSAGILPGIRALGVRRMWWNAQRKQLIGIIFFGGGVAGWPGVTHGGAVATVLMESIATVANGGPRETRGLMSGAESEQEMVSEFSIRYRKPTQVNQMYIIRAEFEDDINDTVKCSLEDIYTSRVTATATGKTGARSTIILGDGNMTEEGITSRILKTLLG